MATETPLLSRKRVIAFELESTYGTPGTLTNADAGLRVFDRNMRIVSDTLRRERQGALGSSAGVAEAKHVELSMTTHIHGHSTVPAYAQLFQACGMELTSRTYTATSDQSVWKGITAGHWVDGRKKLARGMMGNWVARLVSGRIGMIDWTFMGGWIADPAAEAILTGMSYETASARPPVWEGSGSITLDGDADFKVANLTLDFGNEVSLREDPNSDGGFIGGWIGNRLPTITVDPEAMPLGVYSWFTKHSTDVEVAIAISLSNGAGNAVAITASNCQLANAPDDNAERGGRLVDALQFHCNEDAITIVYS